MVAIALVSAEIESGLNLVRALDAAKFGVVAALWFYDADMDRWRLTIAYSGSKRDLEKKTLEAAIAVNEWRSSRPDDPVLELGRVKITNSEDPLVRGLGPIAHLEGLGQVRIQNSLINGIYVEDALIHRMAA